MMIGKYVDANDYGKMKKEYAKVGLPSDQVMAVDKDYAFVPTNVSQKAKSGSANLKASQEMNMRRFGLED